MKKLKDLGTALGAAIIAAILLIPFEGYLKSLYSATGNNLKSVLGLSVDLKVYYIVWGLILYSLLITGVYIIIQKIRNKISPSPSFTLDFSSENKAKESVISKSSLLNRFEGTWDYECILADGMDFPFPKDIGNSHGGSCKIIIETTDVGTKMNVRGTRSWQTVKTGSGYMKINMPHPLEWHDVIGVAINTNQIMYTYAVIGQAVYGITFLKLEEKNGQIWPSGEFFYFPAQDNAPPSTSINIQNMKKRQRGRKFGEVYGHVTYTNHRT